MALFRLTPAPSLVSWGMVMAVMFLLTAAAAAAPTAPSAVAILSMDGQSGWLRVSSEWEELQRRERRVERGRATKAYVSGSQRKPGGAAYQSPADGVPYGSVSVNCEQDASGKPSERVHPIASRQGLSHVLWTHRMKGLNEGSLVHKMFLW